MRISINKILSLYIAITPVFWFWTIPTGVMIPLKLVWLLFIIFFLTVLKNQAIKRKYLLFLTAFSIVFLPALFRTTVSGWLYKYFFFILIILTISAFYNFLRNKTVEEIINFLKFPSLFVAGVCVFTLTNYFFEIPDWREVSANEFYATYLYQTGFSATRTSWTPAISFFFITNLYYFFHEKKSKVKLLFLLAAVCILMSQIFSGGRTGMLISIAALLYYILIKVNTKILLITLLAVIIVVIPQIDIIIKTARLEHVDFTSFEALNNFSTGRLIQMIWGIEKLFEDYNFFIGAGFDLEDVLYDSKLYGEVEIHNFWINTLVRGGVLIFLFYFLFALYYVLRAILLFKKNKKTELFMLVIICGLLGTLIEPSIILGKVQTTIIWWVAIAAIDVIEYKREKEGVSLT